MTRNKHNQVHTAQDGNSEYAIASLLPIGKDNAITTKELVQLAGCGSARELQIYIAEERKKGAVICASTTGGYYLPANHGEIAEFCKSLENRAKNTFVAIQSARRALKTPEGQMSIEREEDNNGK